MKCTNCGNEVNGNFCTKCGAPAPNPEPEQAAPENTEGLQNNADTAVNQPQEPQAYQPQEPQEYQAQPYNGYQENNQPSDNQQNVNQTSFGQQFTNAQGGYTGQQFTNGQPPKKSGGGKTAVIIVSIVAGLIVILCIIFGVVACSNNFVKQISSGISSIASDGYSQISNYVDDNSSEVSDIIDDYSSDIESALGEEKYDEASRFYYTESEEYDGLAITGYEMDFDINSRKINIDVPEKIDGKNVVEIQEIHAYYDDAYVTVTIPGTVKVIRSYSMSFVDEFDEVIIKDGVEIIEENAFLGDDDLKKVTVPESVTQMDDCGIGFEVDDDYNPEPMDYDDFTLYGKKGSTAEKYAKECRLRFIAQ